MELLDILKARYVTARDPSTGQSFWEVYWRGYRFVGDATAMRAQTQCHLVHWDPKGTLYSLDAWLLTCEECGKALRRDEYGSHNSVYVGTTPAEIHAIDDTAAYLIALLAYETAQAELR